ncbi:MAG: DUF6144 family protein [Fidelibacterota bacterium]
MKKIIVNNRQRFTILKTLLSETSRLDDKSLKILHNCGAQCAQSSQLLAGAQKISEKFPPDTDPEQLFQAFKSRYYNYPNFTKEGNTITLIFEECTCPLVKQGADNPLLCHCTVGYSHKIFETLFNQPVKIKLLKSILRGDDACHQEIIL